MMTGKKIENMLEEAWENFKAYFDSNAIRYSHEYYEKRLRELREEKVKEEKAKKDAKKEVKESHWICWNESDLMVQLGRYFYEQRGIESVSNKEFLNIEMHFDKNLNCANFKGYSFESKLWHAHDDSKKELEVLLNDSRKYPTLDLIITCENNFGPFLLCAEAKCFHASVRKGTVEEAIEKDIITLAAIKKLGITENIAYIIFDDYYYNKNPKDIRQLICKYSKEHKIENELKILYHDSKSKLIDVWK
jgi:hypothetical protein